MNMFYFRQFHSNEIVVVVIIVVVVCKIVEGKSEFQIVNRFVSQLRFEQKFFFLFLNDFFQK